MAPSLSTFFCSTHISLFVLCVLFQPRLMVYGRMASPTSVALCCSKLSTTCWSAASWIVALFALASGLSSPTRRMRSLSTRGMLAPLFLWRCPYFLSVVAKRHACACTLEESVVGHLYPLFTVACFSGLMQRWGLNSSTVHEQLYT